MPFIPTFGKHLWPILSLIPAGVMAGPVVSSVPDEIDTGSKFVFYLHGRIVEQQGLRPTHERWGLYDYPAILDALAADSATVISERRQPGTDGDKYAQLVVGQVESLLGAGVPANNISVVGFSAGGIIAMKMSSQMSQTGINFVFLASCSNWLKRAKDLRLNGHILSVYEESDEPASCKSVAERKPSPEEFSEVRLETGLEHGAFYLPRDEWLDPVLDWVGSH